MNGVIDIKALGQTHTLRFGMVGVGEFERRQMINFTENTKKVIVDLVYGGLFGEAMRNEKPAPAYSLATDICDELATDTKVLDAIWLCFEQSNNGIDYLNRIEEKTKELKELKKKIVEATKGLKSKNELKT